MAWLSTQVVESETPEPRSAERRKLHLSSEAHAIHAGAISTTIRDLSETGMLLETTAALDVGMVIAVNLPETGATDATVVWSSGPFFGCEFLTPLRRAAISAAILRNAPQSGQQLPVPVAAQAPQGLEAPRPETSIQKFSLRARAAIIVGSSGLLWCSLVAAYGATASLL